MKNSNYSHIEEYKAAEINEGAVDPPALEEMRNAAKSSRNKISAGRIASG